MRGEAEASAVCVSDDPYPVYSLISWKRSKMMRSVCFVDRLELDFSGNHFSHAVAIGDADNDGVGSKSTTWCEILLF